MNLTDLFKHSINSACIALIIIASMSKAQAQLSMSDLRDSIVQYARLDNKKAFEFSKQALDLAKTLDDPCEVIKYEGAVASYDQFFPIDSSLSMLTTCYQQASENNCSPKVTRKILQDLSWIHRLAGNYNEALDYCRILLDKYADDKNYRFRILNSLAIIYSNIGETDKATSSFLAAYDIANELGSKNKSTLLNNICTVYNDNGFPNKAKEYCDRARKESKEDDYTYAYGLATNTLGCIYNDLNKRDSARMFVEEALGLDLPLQARHYSYLEYGRIEENDGNYEKSVGYYQKAIQIADDLDYPFEEAYARSSLANIFIEQEAFTKAMKESNEAMSIYETLDSSPQELVDVYERHILALSGSGNQVPMEVLDTYFILKDSIFNENKVSNLVDIEEKYQNEKLRADQAEADLQLQQQKYTIWGIGLSLLLLGGLAYFLYRQSQKRLNLIKQVEHSKDQIEILNQELNHRVQNNLAFITTLMQMQSRRATEPETKEILRDSEHRLMALSKVHVSLRSGNSSAVNISDYFSDIIKNLKTAFESDDKRINIKTTVPSEQLDAETTMRLGLIINELITNSMKHVDEAEVNINISIEKTSDKITLKYGDNGTGIERHLQNPKSSDSMGLQLIKILREQLKGRVDVVLM